MRTAKHKLSRCLCRLVQVSRHVHHQRGGDIAAAPTGRSSRKLFVHLDPGPDISGQPTASLFQINLDDKNMISRGEHWLETAEPLPRHRICPDNPAVRSIADPIQGLVEGWFKLLGPRTFLKCEADVEKASHGL